MLNRALRRGLERRPPGKPRPYRCPTFPMGPPRRPLDRALALVDALEEQEIAQRLALRQ